MILGVKLLNNGQIIKNQVEVEILLSSYLQPVSVVLVIILKIANTYINRNRRNEVAIILGIIFSFLSLSRHLIKTP